jgi:hypothetical protein
MSLTTDVSDTRLGRGVNTSPVSQSAVYLVLSEDEIAKGFTRPYRDEYKHVGSRPTYSLRDLTEEEIDLWVTPDDGDETFVKFEQYPDIKNPSTGRFWTRGELEKPACNAVTSMARQLSETYAVNPKFYGSTYCVGCSMHRPVGEFIWVADGETVGS